MSDTPQQAQKQPSYSALDQLRARLDETGRRGLSSLSANDLKAVVIWLESVQLREAMLVAVEDDPMTNAKGRGKVELIVDLCGELIQKIGEVASSTKEEEK